MKKKNIFVSDIAGVIYEGRVEETNEYNARYAQKTDARTLGDVIGGADVFLGVSAPGVLKPEMVKEMAARPLILALANPEPEIRPEAVKEVRDDAVMATGRTDYPNQVNNVLVFPGIFRGALDANSPVINGEMKIAAAVALAGDVEEPSADMILPHPLDRTVAPTIAKKVRAAAKESA